MVLETHMKWCVTEPDFSENIFLPRKLGKWTKHGPTISPEQITEIPDFSHVDTNSQKLEVDQKVLGGQGHGRKMCCSFLKIICYHFSYETAKANYFKWDFYIDL